MVFGSYPATRNRINQQQQQQQQGSDPPPMPGSVYQHNNIIPIAPAATASTAYTPQGTANAPVYAAAAPTQPVMATAFVPQSTAATTPIMATAFVPGQTNASTNATYATAPTMTDLPPPVAPPVDDDGSKFWECSNCTFPNLRSEERCKGCGASIPPGLLRMPQSNAHVNNHVIPQSTHVNSHVNDNLTHQMNNLHVTSHHQQQSAPSGGTMRVPVPQGMQPGQKIKVRSPDGKEVIRPIPPRNEWMMDEHGKPFFRMTFGAPATATSSYSNNAVSSRPQPYQTTWKSFHPHATSTYSPPPIGMQSVPHTPGNSTPISPNGRHKSLIIGINYTGTRAALRGCINDAKSMQSMLKLNGFPDDGSHMLLLTDERSRGSEYQPSASNIMKAFTWFLKDVQKGDVLFFHFSGHGGQVPDKTGMEADGYNETLVPLDYSKSGQISDDVLWGSIVYPLPEGVRLTALMDMCHSGTGLDLPYDYNVDTRRWREDLNPAHSRGDVVLFSGCEDAQTSADVQSGPRAGGAMTMAFTKAYQQCDMVTYHDFLTVIKRELRRNGMRQRPQLTSSQRFDANSRIFSFGHVSGGRHGVPTVIESNHNAQIGRKKNRHVRPARPGFGGGGGNDLFAMAAAGAGAMLFANALGNIFDA